MRLLTHNMLRCPRTTTYPLVLTAQTCDDVHVDFNESFIRRMLPRLDWNVFLNAAQQLPDAETIALIPKNAPAEDAILNENVWRAIHRALLEWHVVDGELQPQGSTTKYMVRNGVPNLVITEVVQPGGDPMHLGQDTMNGSEADNGDGDSDSGDTDGNQAQ